MQRDTYIEYGRGCISQLVPNSVVLLFTIKNSFCAFLNPSKLDHITSKTCQIYIPENVLNTLWYYWNNNINKNDVVFKFEIMLWRILLCYGKYHSDQNGPSSIGLDCSLHLILRNIFDIWIRSARQGMRADDLPNGNLRAPHVVVR